MAPRHVSPLSLCDLPPEILIEISDLILDHLAVELPRLYYIQLRNLQLINRWWKSIIDNHAPFWAIIPYEAPEDVVRTLLVKSGSATLIITNQFGDEPSSVGYKRDNRRFLQLVEPHTHRWRHAYIDFLTSHANDILQLLVSPAPMLKQLILRARDPGRPAPPTTVTTADEITLFNNETPRLRDLRLIFIFLPSHRFNDLRSLHLIATRRILQMMELRDLLHQSPRLIDLKLVSLRIAFYGSLQDSTPILLSHLKSFRIFLPPLAGAYILALLRTPECQAPEFTLSFSSPVPPRTQYAHLEKLITNCLKRSPKVEIECGDYWHVSNQCQPRDAPQYAFIIKGPNPRAGLEWVLLLVGEAAPTSITLRDLPEQIVDDFLIASLRAIRNVHRLDIRLPVPVRLLAALGTSEDPPDGSVLFPELRHLVLYPGGGSLKDALMLLHQREEESERREEGMERKVAKLERFIVSEDGPIDWEIWAKIVELIGPKRASIFPDPGGFLFEAYNVPDSWISMPH